ncbi:hypothetical protein Q8W71_00535 [Methylobacterium sp. NEAU 140]|uniref:hypothetical protein n=1 Tax=Methylobacterium sp. NEAU 140 TaxID=3064945 RepID=UPI0027373E5E|nr:hypothetical protein [Methylobacterium sp. NEAU 140]MDP4021096.1 hypothetical protein [Methylobacterium sp. NEAU 140]
MANNTTLRLTLAGPPEDIAAFKAAHIVENTNRGYDGCPVRLSFETFAEYPSGEGRNWAYKNWGSAYNAGDFKFIRDEPGEIEVRFDAYNGDAEPIFQQIAHRFPEFYGRVLGIEDGGFYSCSGEFTLGLFTYRRAEWSKDAYEQVHGRPYEEPEDEEPDADDAAGNPATGSGAILDTLASFQAAASQTWFHSMAMSIAMGITTVEAMEGEWKADQERRDALIAAGKMDAYGNRFFEVGDLVTRDGTDIHRVVEHNGSPGRAPDGFTVVCVSPPEDGWCEVGDVEFNICRRYEWVTDPVAGNPASPNLDPGAGPPSEAVDLHRGESLYASIIVAERERHRREMEAWRAEFERGYLRPTRNAWVDVLVDVEAAKAARLAIGKPLSRRARRRNRGRVTTAKVALARVYHEPVTWAWPAQEAA